jgi:FixJ family two-component response regulator
MAVVETCGRTENAGPHLTHKSAITVRQQMCCTFPRGLVSRGIKRDGRSFDHRTLNRLNIGLPVILMTAFGDISMSVKGMQAGQVMALFASRFMNKQVANELSISEVTVKMHRSSVTRKFGVKYLARLARIAEILDIQI